MPVLARPAGDIYYEITGDTGPALLLTHGYGATSAMFAQNVAALAAGHRVLTWDLRGHGRSAYPADPAAYSAANALADLSALLATLGAGRAVLGGHSLGGYLSLEFALAFPERVSALVLIGTGPGYRNDAARDDWNRRAHATAGRLADRGLAGLGRSAELDGGQHRDASGLIHAATQTLTQRDARVIDGLPGIAVPTLVIVGAEDTPFLGAADYMTAKVPGARKVVIEGAGHAPNVSEPGVFNAEVTRFLGAESESGDELMAERAESAATEATPEQLRTEVAAWVREHWDPDRPLRDWRELLLQAGWAVPSWPHRWHGRGLPGWADELVAGELVRLGAVGAPVGSGSWLAAPTILAHGPDELRDRLLPPILTGAQTWCQLFSEPGAGSDLAGLSTTAVLDGDSWVVNGQKVWNTSAHHADMGMLLARTDSSVPKHQGITYFALPMQQPGVEVRQLRQMNFHASFNEVFLTDARVPAANVIGEVGHGWAAALTTLSYERRFAALQRPRYAAAAGRALEEARAEADRHFATYSWYPQRAGRPDLVMEHARLAGVADDPVIRQAIARLVTMHRVSVWTAERARQARARGARPGAEGSIGKLAASNVARESARVHSMIAAAAGLLTGPDSPLGGVIAEVLMSVPGQSIAGGTDEIQKNILAEKMLGLPAEIRVDRNVPFSELKGRG